jgi:large subunit ribosomal protein L22
MGSRKHIRAEKEKEARKSLYIAKLNNNPSSPRKTRLVADMVRGLNVEKALHLLQYSPKESAIKIRKLLLSAIANWQVKNEGSRIEDSNLYIKEIFVDGGRQLKRIRTAPQGRAHRIRKRSSHITLIIDDRNKATVEEEVVVENK